MAWMDQTASPTITAKNELAEIVADNGGLTQNDKIQKTNNVALLDVPTNDISAKTNRI